MDIAAGDIGAEEHDVHVDKLILSIVFMLTTFAVCTLLDLGVSRMPERIRPPYTVVVFTLGMLMGWWAMPERSPVGGLYDTVLHSVQNMKSVPPEAILFVFLPSLIYEDSASMSYHTFTRVLKSSILLAIPGVIINTVVTGSYIMWTFGPVYEDFYVAFLLASILSATDPVAVIASLNSLGAPGKLSTLISGEALLNDGSAMVVFALFLDAVAKYNMQCELPWNAGCVSALFARLAIGGVIFGLVVAHMTYLIIRVFKNPLMEVSFMLVVTYACFFFAEHYLHVSGVLAVVTAGIYFSSQGFSALSCEGQHNFHAVLGQIAYLSNQAIFLIAGILSFEFIFNSTLGFHTDTRMWLNLFALYFMLHFARALMIIMFWPLLTRWGYGMTWKEAMIMWFGGLRGAVSLTLALMVVCNDHIKDQELKQSLVFYVSGCVLLTLFINGTTVTMLYEYLNVYPENPFHQIFIKKSLHRLENDFRSKVAILQKHFFYKDVQTEVILQMIPNYSHVDFDARSVPIPKTSPTSMSEVLNDLGEIAEYRKAQYGPKEMDFYEVRKDIVRESIVAQSCRSTRQNRPCDHLGVTHCMTKLPIHEAAAANFWTCTPEKAPERNRTCFFPSLQSIGELGHPLEFQVTQHNWQAIIGVMPANFVPNRLPGIAPESVGFLVSKNEFVSTQLDIIPPVAPHCMEIVTLDHQDTDQGCIIRITCGGQTSERLMEGCNSDQLYACVALHQTQAQQLQEAATERYSIRSEKGLIGTPKSGPRYENPSTHYLSERNQVVVNFKPVYVGAFAEHNEVYLLLFNSLKSMYKEAYEEREIGSKAYNELCECVNTGMDAANLELKNFTKKQAKRSKTQAAMMARSGDSGALNEETRADIDTFMKHDHTQSVFRKLKTMVQRNEEFDDSDFYSEDVFDPTSLHPLDIEYGCLMHWLADASIYDFATYRCIRRFAKKRTFRTTRQKMEALLLYIETHECILKHNVYLGGFCDIREKMEALINDAKTVMLSTMECLQPRRTYFATHGLFLRSLVSTKIGMLKDCVKEGVMDGEVAEAIIQQHLYPLVKKAKHGWSIPAGLTLKTGDTSTGILRRQSDDHPEGSIQETQTLMHSDTDGENPGDLDIEKSAHCHLTLDLEKPSTYLEASFRTVARTSDKLQYEPFNR